MPSEDDLRRLYRERAGLAEEHTPDFAATLIGTRHATTATRSRSWAIAGVAAAVVAAAVAIPVVVNQSRPHQPAAVAPAGSGSADATAIGVNPPSGTTASATASPDDTTGRKSAAAPPRSLPVVPPPTTELPAKTFSASTSAEPTSAETSAATTTAPKSSVPKESAAKPSAAKPAPTGAGTVRASSAAGSASVKTVAAGTDRMKLRELNASVCLLSLDGERIAVPGSFDLTSMFVVAARDSGVKIENRYSVRSQFALRLSGLGTEYARATFTESSELTVPADAVKLSVEGRDAYFAKLCGSGTLAWQWSPGKWSVVVNVTQQQGIKMATALQFSNTPRTLPFKVTKPLFPLDRAPMSEVGWYWMPAAASPTSDLGLTYGYAIDDASVGRANISVTNPDPMGSDPGDRPTTINGRPAKVSSFEGAASSVQIRIDLGGGYTALISGKGSVADVTKFAENIEFADVNDPSSWFKVSDSVH